MAEEELNFHNAREEIRTEINLEHPIVFDQYNICALVNDNPLKKLRMGFLQMLCEKFQLQGSITDRRKSGKPCMQMLSLILSMAVHEADALDLNWQI